MKFGKFGAVYGKIKDLRTRKNKQERQNGQKKEKSRTRGNAQEQATPRDRKTTPREPNANKNTRPNF